MNPRIVTVTLNPTIDTAFEAERVFPWHKVHTFDETHDPGGGGVNVARVLTELGAETCAVVLAGGIPGEHLVQLLGEAGVPCRAIRIGGITRVSTTVHDHSTGDEYRFVPEGPMVDPAELDAAVAALDDEPGEWIVISGSLPRGLPADTYAMIVKREAARGRRVVLDTSGPPLRAALGHGLALIKPSERELRELVGSMPVEEAARELVRSGAAERVAVTMGPAGALIATAGGLVRRPAIAVEAKGAVGAGDSFLAAMVMALARGSDAEDALLWGLAAGAAAVSRTGTAHPHREDVVRFYQAERATIDRDQGARGAGVA